MNVMDTPTRQRTRLIDGMLIAVYVGGIVLANGLVTAFGQPALPFTAFFLIPMDLVVRDLLQDRWQISSTSSKLRTRMLLLIAVGSLISFVTTIGSSRIAAASMVAFAITGVIDAATYQMMIRYGRVFRINAATIIAAFTDSIVFAAIAFDHVDDSLVLVQAATKIVGGFVWSLLLFRYFIKRS